MHRGKTNLEFWWQKRDLYPTPTLPIAPTQTADSPMDGREETEWKTNRGGNWKWEVFPGMENNDFCPMEVNGGSRGALWCSPVPAHEITNLLVPPNRRLTNRRTPEGFEGNTAGPITSFRVCAPFHTIDSRGSSSSSKDLQARGQKSGCPWVLRFGGCRGESTLDPAFRSALGCPATDTGTACNIHEHAWMHEFRRVQTRQQGVSDTSPESTPPPPHGRAVLCWLKFNFMKNSTEWNLVSREEKKDLPNYLSL